MYYISKDDNGFTKALLSLETGSADPEPGLHYFGSMPVLNKTDYHEKCYNGKHLVLNPHTGTWCFLPAEEYGILQAIDHVTCQSLHEKFPCMDMKALEEFAFYLFLRNIITINRHTFIEESLFEDKPLKRVGGLFIVEATKRCNLHCSYCFAECNSKKQPLMHKKSAGRIIDLILATDFEWISIEFSGGEALLAFDFIRYFVEELKNRITLPNNRIQLTMQTNATLLDEQKLDFLVENGITFGISMDGSQQYNDATRKYPNGKGTYNDIMRAVGLLQRKGRSIGLLSVLSSRNSQNYIDNLKFFKSLSVSSIKLNPVFRNGRAEENWDELAVDDREILKIQQQYLDYCIAEADPVRENNVQSMLENMSSCFRGYRCMLSCCGAGENFFTFAPDGNIYPCARYQNTEKYRMGNIDDPDLQLQSLYKGNALIGGMRSRKVAGIEKCRKCVYRRFCEGNCSLDTYETFDSWQHPHPRCDYYRGMYDLLFDYISQHDELPKKLDPGIRVFNRNFI